MLKKIRLELARSPGFPSGSAQHGYVLVAPLDHSGRLDAVMWMDQQNRCRVTKFWGFNPHRQGQLRFRTCHSGDRGCQWYVRYATGDDPDTPEREAEEELGFHFENEQFVAGEYVAFSDGTHEPLAFRVASVEPADVASVHVTHL